MVWVSVALWLRKEEFNHGFPPETRKTRHCSDNKKSERKWDKGLIQVSSSLLVAAHVRSAACRMLKHDNKPQALLAGRHLFFIVWLWYRLLSQTSSLSLYTSSICVSLILWCCCPLHDPPLIWHSLLHLFSPFTPPSLSPSVRPSVTSWPVSRCCSVDVFSSCCSFFTLWFLLCWCTNQHKYNLNKIYFTVHPKGFSSSQFVHS